MLTFLLLPILIAILFVFICTNLFHFYVCMFFVRTYDLFVCVGDLLRALRTVAKGWGGS
jgi:membrane protein YdbS with pleckstrin-like domain